MAKVVVNQAPSPTWERTAAIRASERDRARRGQNTYFRVATGDRKGQVKPWDTHAGKELVPLDRPVRPETPVAMLVFSPDGQTLAGGWWPTAFGDLVLWDVKTGNHKRSLKGSSDDIEAIAFSPDGRLVVGGSGGSARGYVWEVASGQPRKTILGHATSVIGLAFSPDGKTLATGSYDTIKLRNVATLQEVVSFPTERAVLRGLHFSPDGKTLAAGYLPFAGPPDGTNRVNNFVRLYHAPSLEEIAVIEARETNSIAQ